jgi:flagella basal body P-ring formation protein FlgA
VKLVVRSGAVRLSAAGIAREDGLPGDRILVQKAGTHERLRGTVAPDGTVEILVR